MADLQEQFEQAARIGRQRKQSPPLAQRGESLERLDALYRAATEGDPSGREAAMRQYIELVGDLGQQDG
jgi:acyl-CoA-binding protein